MILLEVVLQRIVVLIVMRLPRISPIAYETALMLVTTMFVQFVTVVESFFAESAHWVALEPRLRNVTGLIISVCHVLVECILVGKKLVFVRKDFFVSRT